MKFYDVLVPKDYETKQNGQAEKRTAWNKIGVAWYSKTGDSLIFELFHVSNQKFVVSLKEKEATETKTEEAPF